jgi:pectinesterase
MRRVRILKMVTDVNDRIFEEYNNSGAGSSTASRVYETTATAAVSKKVLWGGDYDSWIDASY